MLRVKTLEDMLKCHNLFVNITMIGSILVFIGVMLLCQDVFQLGKTSSIMIAIGVSILLGTSLLRILNKALVSMYNDRLKADTVRLTEMLVTGDLIKEDKYINLVTQLIDTERNYANKSE